MYKLSFINYTYVFEYCRWTFVDNSMLPGTKGDSEILFLLGNGFYQETIGAVYVL